MKPSDEFFDKIAKLIADDIDEKPLYKWFFFQDWGEYERSEADKTPLLNMIKKVYEHGKQIKTKH